MSSRQLIAQNRKARHEYSIEEVLEAGISLVGTEVKSLRAGRANIGDAYAAAHKGEIYLYNAQIEAYDKGNRFNHEERRARKLLLHKKQVSKLIGQTKNKGVTLVPLSIYFNSRGIAKVELALVKGRKEYEKREAKKEQEWKREQQRLLKNKG